MDILESFSNFISTLDGILWGLPLIIILLGTHLFITLRTRFVQRYVFRGIKLSILKDESAHGEVSQFGALTTALAATIGTGNIVGVATAIIAGGPGSVFWMWVIGIFGMATKYAETLISVKYRVRTSDGRMLGGAMYALQRGLHQKWLAVLFALFASIAAFGIGCMTQANSISSAMSNNFGIPSWITGLFAAVLVAIVIIGGVKSITRVTGVLIPFMAIFYIVGCVVLLIMNGSYVWDAVVLIIKDAFTADSVFGGGLGFTAATAIRYGCARGLFSNESGMGSAPLVAAAAQTKNPVRQSLVSMTGTFWDTVVICLVTGLTVVSSVLKYQDVAAIMSSGTSVLTFEVFNHIPVVGKPLITISLALFAFSTILGWSYYGEKAAEYLCGPKVILPYKCLFVLFTMVGATLSLDLVWNIADILNGFMIIPNVIGVLGLSGVIVAEGRKYLNDIEKESDDEIPTI